VTYQLRDAGEFTIYATAVDSPHGGYVAAVEVRTATTPAGSHQVVFSDANLSNGFRFETPADALKHALDAGHRVVRQLASDKAA
jgi:hypothetical protein